MRSPRATRQDGRRRGSYPHIAFTFLGYAFRPRGVRTKTGTMMTGFNPAISRDALTKTGHACGPGGCTGAPISPQRTSHAGSTRSCGVG